MFIRLFIRIVFGVFIFIIVFIFLFIGVMRTKRPIYYSIDKVEAIKNGTFINSYDVKSKEDKILSEGILVYGLKKKLIFDEIQNDNIKLSIKKDYFLKEIRQEKNIYWEAHFNGEKLTTFEEKGRISIIGVNKKRDEKRCFQ